MTARPTGLTLDPLPLAHYTGAVTAVDLPSVLALDPARWCVQSKKDGVFVEAALDERGCIDTMLMRSGRPVPPVWAQDLIGVRAGSPHAVVAGELEAWTEASQAAVAKRGYPLYHLFDLLDDGSGSLAGRPYRDRWDALQRMHADLQVVAGDDRPWLTRSRRRDGTFSAADHRPRAWRRVPIVPMLSVTYAGRLFVEALDAGDEGLVVVDMTARAGKGKLKLKRRDAMDCVVGQVDSGAMYLTHHPACGQFVVGKSKRVDAVAGCIVEVAFEGFYKTGTPRFPRLVRRRYDLEPPERLLELGDLPSALEARIRGDAYVEGYRREREIPRR